ncbi:MAG: adenosylcobinamide-GDP ribazoletransferase, partial [Eubacteriales bacterium]|nr:adenosylcobinamide-GDP ribazoletransferase [Eubacteriales bacterium]
MKKMLDSLVLSLSMFTTCPLPRRDYDAESLSYMMAFFPVAGLYVSLVAAATYYLSGLLPISTVLRAALLLIAICVATGGIHLDGFSDASDALFSRRDVNKMLEIMHD